MCQDMLLRRPTHKKMDKARSMQKNEEKYLQISLWIPEEIVTQNAYA